MRAKISQRIEAARTRVTQAQGRQLPLPDPAAAKRTPTNPFFPRKPSTLTLVGIDAVRLVLAEGPATAADVREQLIKSGLRPRDGVVQQACAYLYFSGETICDQAGRYELQRRPS